MKTDAYATWDPSKATDKPDGLPDRGIVPLVEFLQKSGVVTLQSCYGHEGQSDGHLWVDASTTSDRRVRIVLDNSWDQRVFDKVSHVIWPEDRWEFVWTYDRAPLAVKLLKSLVVR